MVVPATAEVLSQLGALIVEDNDGKARLIDNLLHDASVRTVGRLATMREVRAELDGHAPDGQGLLASANVFFVDGNMGPGLGLSIGSDGEEVIKELEDRGIAFPAARLVSSRGDYPDRIPGVVFGCSLSPGDGYYGDVVHGYNLDPGARDAASELTRMLSMAGKLLSLSV